MKLRPLLAMGLLGGSLLIASPHKAEGATIDGLTYFLDGVYNCNASLDGALETTTFALNEKPDEELILMFAATSETVGPFIGFGAGRLSGSSAETFSGTSAGGSFSFDVTYGDMIEPGLYAEIRLNGSYTLPNGKTAQMECQLEW